MVDIVGVHTPHEAELFFPSWWNIRQKVAIATLCVLCAEEEKEQPAISKPQPGRLSLISALRRSEAPFFTTPLAGTYLPEGG
jgi:hypothetical protein